MKKNRMSNTRFNWVFIPLGILLVTLLAVTLSMIMQAVRYDSSCDWSGSSLASVGIKGDYSEEGGPWMPFSKETQFDYHTKRNITIRGSLTRDIPKGDKLYFNICQLWVTLRINGEEAFSFGPRKGDGNPAQSIGNLWYGFESPGITSDDEIELSFGNLYPNAYYIQFDNLLWNMYTGSERALLSAAVQKDAGLLVMGAIFLILTLFLLIGGILLTILRISGAIQFLWLGLCTLFSSLWFLTLSPALSLLLPFPVLLNTLYAYSIQVIALSIVLFAAANLSGWRKKTLFLSAGVLMAAMTGAIILQISGTRDMYSTIDYFSLFDTGIALLMFFCLTWEIRFLKNKKLYPFLTAMLPLVILGVLEMLNGIVQWTDAGIFFGLGLFLFAMLEGFFILLRIRKSLESEKRVLVLEKELAQNRISVMLSQIQPHFLYNSLVGIKELCDTKPPLASDALEHFSYYLRGNLDSLSNTGLIPFKKEVEHVQDYLYLEKMRYEERIQIQWQLEYQDFILPPLTLQTVVENAVRYGITQKGGRGTVTIRSERSEETVIITVQDDGAGFNPEEKKEDGRTHIGLQNVGNRLTTLCGGSLVLKSKIGLGTEVKIILPQRRNTADENNCG